MKRAGCLSNERPSCPPNYARARSNPDFLDLKGSRPQRAGLAEKRLRGKPSIQEVRRIHVLIESYPSRLPSVSQTATDASAASINTPP
jgi:hypothetical protein